MTETLSSETKSAPRLVTFDAVRLPLLGAEVEKLNKVARRLGVPEITFEVVERGTRQKIYDSFLSEWLHSPIGTPTPSVTYDVEIVTVAIEGESPRLPGGWTFLGSIEHLADGANMVHGDDPALAGYRTAGPNCDHCGFKRDRSRTIIVRADDGRIAQVGSACMKDFLGFHGDPERVVRWADEIRELADDFESEGFGGRAADWGTPTHVFLSVVAAVVRTHGWVPKSAYKGLPTATLAKYVLGIERPLSKDHEAQTMMRAVEVTEADKREAEAVKAWAEGIPAGTDNNYLGNVRVALLGEYVLDRHIGIAASAVSARRKAEEKDRDRAEAEGRRAASEFVGEVGKRQEFEVEVKFVRAIEGDYGTTYLVVMEDRDGNTVKTFNSGEFGRQANRGGHGTIKATVKAHEVYEGRNETMVTRVKGADWHEDEE